LAPGGKAWGMWHRGRGYHIHRSTGDKGSLLMYCSQPGELLAVSCTLVQLTTTQPYSSQPYNLLENFRTHVQLTIRWIIGWSLYSCTAHNRTTYQKISVLMYSSQSGEFLAGRCTLVQLATIQLIRRFPYSCTAHNQVNYWLVAVPLYSSQPYNLSEESVLVHMYSLQSDNCWHTVQHLL